MKVNHLQLLASAGMELTGNDMRAAESTTNPREGGPRGGDVGPLVDV